MNADTGAAKISLRFWRETCRDRSDTFVVLMRAVPASSAPRLCFTNFKLLQSGVTFDAALLISVEGSAVFCGPLVNATTLVLGWFPVNGKGVNTAQAFTVFFGGSPNSTLEIPAFGPQPPPLPTIAVVATGCTTCHSGQTAGYRIDFTNGGPAFTAELKGGARFPNGSGLPLLNQVSVIPAGSSSLTLFPLQALPGGLPTLDLVIEAAILDPIFGVTVSRTSTTLHLLP